MMKNFTENFIFMPETSKASMKPDQERVKTLLTDTVTLLCKNGLQYSKELKVQGLLGITLDNDDVFVVHINEIFNGLLGAQVSSLKAEETRSATSAIAAADSATSDVPLKSSSRKGIPQKYENSSPSGSSKRKAHTPTPVKKEYHSEDEIVIMDSKSMDSDEFNDEIGDGDREAMRKSYGEMLEPPVAKRRVADSSGAFRDKQSSTFFSGIVADTKAELGESDDILDDSSLENSTGLGNMTTDGQTLFENSAGCSAWEGTGAGPPTQTESGQDSDEVAAWPATDLVYINPVSLTMEEFEDFDGTTSKMAPRPKYFGVPNINRKGRKFQCTIAGCEKIFSYTFDVYRHQRAHHKISPSLYTKGRGASFEAYKVIDPDPDPPASNNLNDAKSSKVIRVLDQEPVPNELITNNIGGFKVIDLEPDPDEVIMGSISQDSNNDAKTLPQSSDYFTANNEPINSETRFVYNIPYEETEIQDF